MFGKKKPKTDPAALRVQIHAKLDLVERLLLLCVNTLGALENPNNWNRALVDPLTRNFENAVNAFKQADEFAEALGDEVLKVQLEFVYGQLVGLINNWNVLLNGMYRAVESESSVLKFLPGFKNERQKIVNVAKKQVENIVLIRKRYVH